MVTYCDMENQGHSCPWYKWLKEFAKEVGHEDSLIKRIHETPCQNCKHQKEEK